MATRAKAGRKEGTKTAAVAGLGRGCDCENQESYDSGPVEGLKTRDLLILRHSKARLWILQLRRLRHTS
jgi:hypothetical protein